MFSNWKYEQQEIQLHSGDRILMFTDGVTEAADATGQEFGERRLIDLLVRLQHLDAAALTEETVDAVRAFSNGNFEDDLTVVSVSVDQEKP